MVVNDKLNLTMLCDFYELTMGAGYFANGYTDRITYFDLFFRRCPDGGGFAIAAGLEQIVQYIQELHFDPEDIAYLRERKCFNEDFLNYLANFKFTGDIWAVPEGTPIFPREPIIPVRAPAIQAQLVETYLLLCVNHQSLIATKANRVVRAAEGRTVLEFGSRRAQGADAAILGARAAYIGGCHGTACTISDQLYGVHAGGTMAHAWVQMFDSEYEAFKAYVKMFPNNATLLVDTYNTLKSGVPNAIRAFNEILKPMGITKCGIRLDSGDLAYLSREARKMLDEAGFGAAEFLAMGDYGIDVSRYGWGSEEFVHDTHLILEQTTLRGMGASMTSGTNWSNANLNNITPDDKAAAKELAFVAEEVPAGGRYSRQIPRPKITQANVHEQTLIAVVAMKNLGLAADGKRTLLPTDGVVLTGQVKDGFLNWKAPEGGDYLLFSVWMQGTGQTASPSCSVNYTINYIDKYGTQALIDYWNKEVLTPSMRETLLKNGRVAETGTPAELMPKLGFVAKGIPGCSFTEPPELHLTEIPTTC